MSKSIKLSVCNINDSHTHSLTISSDSPGLSLPKLSVVLRALPSLPWQAQHTGDRLFLGKLQSLMGKRALPSPSLSVNRTHHFVSTEDGTPDFSPGWLSGKPCFSEVRPPFCNLPFITVLPCHIKLSVSRTQTFICNFAGSPSRSGVTWLDQKQHLGPAPWGGCGNRTCHWICNTTE